jgi:AcrR family transcriptional regulator
MRADAAVNRMRLLHAAREATLAAGPDVAAREIAERAGLGVSTLYRHFPTREALYTESAVEGWRAVERLLARAPDVRTALLAIAAAGSPRWRQQLELVLDGAAPGGEAGV